jgi:hypothetical protein
MWARMGVISTMSRVARAVGALCLSACAAFAQTAAQIEEAARGAIARLDLQTEMPGDPRPSWLDVNLPAINISTWMLWAILAIAIAFVLYSVRDDLPRLIFGNSKRWDDVEGAETAAGANASPEQAALVADDLAKQGYYVEAMHVLLLRAIAEMREKLGADFARSMTSREILRRAKLPEPTKTPLRDIITRVELSYFGAYPAEAEDYLACRDSFDRFMGQLGLQGSRV